MISEHNRDRLEEIIQAESFEDIELWALEHFDLYARGAVEEARVEGYGDGLLATRQEAKNNAPFDPLACINSALAHGQIGQVSWALVERGDGLVLAIGDLNVPIDTAREAQQTIDAATSISHHILCSAPLTLRDWPGTLP